jgi:hypothetical protein
VTERRGELGHGNGCAPGISPLHTCQSDRLGAPQQNPQAGGAVSRARNAIVAEDNPITIESHRVQQIVVNSTSNSQELDTLSNDMFAMHFVVYSCSERPLPATHIVIRIHLANLLDELLFSLPRFLGRRQFSLVQIKRESQSLIKPPAT